MGIILIWPPYLRSSFTNRGLRNASSVNQGGVNACSGKSSSCGSPRQGTPGDAFPPLSCPRAQIWIAPNEPVTHHYNNNCDVSEWRRAHGHISMRMARRPRNERPLLQIRAALMDGDYDATCDDTLRTDGRESLVPESVTGTAITKLGRLRNVFPLCVRREQPLSPEFLFPIHIRPVLIHCNYHAWQDQYFTIQILLMRLLLILVSYRLEWHKLM